LKTALLAFIMKMDTPTIVMLFFLFFLTIGFIAATAWAITDDTHRGGR